MPLYIYKNNQQLGPYEEAFVIEGLQNGQFSSSDLAIQQDMTEWQPLGKIVLLERRLIETTAARFPHKWFWPLAFISLSATVFSIGFVAPQTPGIIYGLFVFLFLAEFVILSRFTFQLWKQIQDEWTTISPRDAASWLFIPVFNLYWIFRVWAGYADAHNKFRSRYGLPNHVSEGVTLAFTLSWLLSWLFLFTGRAPLGYLFQSVMLLIFVAHTGKLASTISAKLYKSADAPAINRQNLENPLPQASSESRIEVYDSLSRQARRLAIIFVVVGILSWLGIPTSHSREVVDPFSQSGVKITDETIIRFGLFSFLPPTVTARAVGRILNFTIFKKEIMKGFDDAVTASNAGDSYQARIMFHSALDLKRKTEINNAWIAGLVWGSLFVLIGIAVADRKKFAYTLGKVIFPIQICLIGIGLFTLSASDSAGSFFVSIGIVLFMWRMLILNRRREKPLKNEMIGVRGNDPTPD